MYRSTTHVVLESESSRKTRQKSEKLRRKFFSDGKHSTLSSQKTTYAREKKISYEENELLSFDQKLLTGLHFKYDYSDNDYFNGGLYYYNQSW